MKLLEFQAVRKGALRGFASVELAIGLTIRDCPICESHGKAWAGLPGKPQIDRDGQLIRDDRGKLAYAAVLEWRDKRLRDAFSDRVVEIVRAQHPDAFDEQGGAGAVRAMTPVERQQRRTIDTAARFLDPGPGSAR